MSPSFAGWDERTLDLAIDRFTVGLDERDAADLERMADRVDLQEFEETLAAIHLACMPALEAPRPELLARLERQGLQQLAASARTPERSGPRAFGARVLDSRALASRAFALGGWLAAAALLLTLIQLGPRTGADAGARREALIASARDLVRVDWTATDDPAAAGAAGDVVWSSALQEGYMRFRNLAPNDPGQHQYQLWIFDPTRADWEAEPVDGGVFDVPPGVPAGGAVVVPIDPKLAVRETALFAVTLEVPGGVVVSERERLVLTAAL